jgi:hypothetical protein
MAEPAFDREGLDRFNEAAEYSRIESSGREAVFFFAGDSAVAAW